MWSQALTGWPEGTNRLCLEAVRRVTRDVANINNVALLRCPRYTSPIYPDNGWNKKVSCPEINAARDHQTATGGSVYAACP